jgi:outer membrane immunogenic protein
MFRVKSTILAAVGVTIALGQVALAADLPQRPAYKAPMLAPAPVYNWTGCYVGANIGAAWGRGQLADDINGGSVSATNNGFAGGGQIGCDYQMGAFVIGIRNLLDGTSLSGSGTFGSGPLAGFTGHTDTSWFDTLTARAGYLVQPNWLFYGQGGVAWMRSNQWVNNPTGTQVAQIGNNTTGWTIGGGTEYMFMPHWSVFVEYNYMNFGTSSANFNVNGFVNAVPTVFPVSVSAKRDAQNVLLGLNYKF